MAKSENQITIPEDFSGIKDEDLQALHDRAVEAFQASLPGEGDPAPSDEALEALAAIADGIEAVKVELASREASSLARTGKAKELADKVLSAADTAGEVQAEEAKKDEEEGKEPEPEPEAKVEEEQPAELVAGAKKRAPLTIDLGTLQSARKAAEPEPTKESKAPAKVALAAQGAAGFNVGEELTVHDMAESINSRLGGFNASAYAAARQRRNRMNERFTIARIPRKFDERAIVVGEDPKSAMDFAADEANIPGKGGQGVGSLVASGGWCAPSETKYEILDISEAENLVSTPEIQINRGGVRTTLGPDYRTVFADVGFTYTEAEDIEGDYDGEGGGTKPCVTVPCPDFEDTRLGYSGVCIGAGLLQQRGYPEAIEDYINKTLNAHAHKVSASVINQMVAESESIVFPGPQAGATAPLLTAIDLQATHLRAINRMKDTATLETVLPTWTKAVIRGDLARRLGVDLLDVPDARIAAWFAARHVNVQYVVDWQDISTTPAANFTAAPSGVDFLLYPAGAFVKGVTDSITLENIYDSVGLGTNDFTALFTEDPYLVLKRLHDTRVVTVPISPNGATHRGVLINANGTFSN